MESSVEVMNRSAARRWAEMVVMFGVAPVVVAQTLGGVYVFPAIWTLAAICLVVLLRDKGFDRGELWNRRGVRAGWREIAMRGAAVAGLLVGVQAIADRGLLFGLVRERPLLWGVIMVAYPVLSVYPQEVAFRAFFSRRYRGLFGREGAYIAVNAAAFGWAHLIMHNWLAVGMSAVGGVLLAQTYERRRSLGAVWLEHTVYGWALFTVGWGAWFYGGTFGR